MSDQKNQMDLLVEDPNSYLIRYRVLLDDPHYRYQAIGTYWYYSERYKKWLFLEAGDKSDGATGAWDIKSNGWWFHDVLCRDGCWFDGDLVSNHVASMVLRDILWAEANYYRSRRQWRMFLSRGVRSIFWYLATFLFGGGLARKNGLVRV